MNQLRIRSFGVKTSEWMIAKWGFLKIFLKPLQLPSQIKSVRCLFILLTYNRTVYVLFYIPSFLCFQTNIPQSSLKRTKFMWSIGNIRFSEISFILILLKSYIFTTKYKPISLIHAASKNHFSVTTLQFEQKPWDIRYYMLLEIKIYFILVKIKLS